MGKRTDIKKILVIGAGPIVIGQACEFDYSGTQACKALREEGYFVILVNSNPATIMTDANIADKTYIEPITLEFVEKIIAKERPDAILPTVGGQTALNCALDLWKNGILDKYQVELIGAKPDAIDKAENRERFNQAMHEIGLDVAKNIVVNNLDDAIKVLDFVGLPAVIRPSFTLGGSGGGVAYSREEFIEIVSYGLSISPTHEVLIDESLIGWKEYEMEVVRDRHDNAIIICSIENIDPMGVHTGDSITVAPALTLTDKEYQRMRSASIEVLRVIGVETGGSNVQFAINPKDGRMIVIEMNPRVSRSSALASKATGFPIAKIAAKLAIGYTLDELKNDITRYTPASFEPTIDYVVIKIPRFTFEKFGVENNHLTTSMKSVGEVMAIGRSFAESLNKALRSLDVGLTGLNSPQDAELQKLIESNCHSEQAKMAARSNNSKINQEICELLKKRLAIATPERIFYIAEALRAGITLQEIQELTHFDPWFIEQFALIIEAENEIVGSGRTWTRKEFVAWKKMGFCDQRIALLANVSESQIKQFKQKEQIAPVYKTIDTCAAEFASYTPYLYSTYCDDGFKRGECEANITKNNKVIILGSGPNRIGQGIEFDYACCHVAMQMRHFGIETIMINCNPETVSTDYDTSDKLYFDPLYYEDVIAIIERESADGHLLGVLVQFGGQTPLKLARYLEEAHIKILGTSLDSIDLAEDRGRFKGFLDALNISQPQSLLCNSIHEIPETCKKIGYPVIIRPSNVLGGRAMEILYDDKELDTYLTKNTSYILDGVILVDKFLENAIEVDVDAICDGENVYIAGIMEQLERAGVHSGDSACVLPPKNLAASLVDTIKEHTKEIAVKLKVHGLLNIQYAIQNGHIYVIEVNPRASRTIPFVAKATQVPLIKIVIEVLLGTKLKDIEIPRANSSYYAIKEVVFPWARFNSDIILSPEMKSTGEVMGFDVDFKQAFIKAQIAAANFSLLQSGSKVLVLSDKIDGELKEIIETLTQNNVTVIMDELFIASGASPSNSKISYMPVAKIKALLENKEINYVITLSVKKEWYGLRRSMILSRIPYTSTLETSKIYVEANFNCNSYADFKVNALQDIA